MIKGLIFKNISVDYTLFAFDSYIFQNKILDFVVYYYLNLQKPNLSRRL